MQEMHPLSGIGDDAYYLLDDLDILTMQRDMISQSTTPRIRTPHGFFAG